MNGGMSDGWFLTSIVIGIALLVAVFVGICMLCNKLHSWEDCGLVPNNLFAHPNSPDKARRWRCSSCGWQLDLGENAPKPDADKKFYRKLNGQEEWLTCDEVKKLFCKYYVRLGPTEAGEYRAFDVVEEKNGSLSYRIVLGFRTKLLRILGIKNRVFAKERMRRLTPKADKIVGERIVQ